MPRPLNEQTVVVTGASSGIGREAALLLAARGANVVLAARDQEALKDVADEIERAGGGGHALTVATDVAEWLQVQNLAAQAVRRFGRIDTWVNNAGVGVGGTVEEVEVDEIARIVQVNLMGQIHGVKAALPYMRQAGSGAFINIGSVAGVRAFPLQTVYCATKHAIKGFTEGLRLELQRDGANFHVTLIAPSAINTPFFSTARTKFGTQLKPPPPVYEPTIVAESIVFAAEHPRRDIFIGGGRLFDILERISPAMTDWMLTRGDAIFKMQVSDRPEVGPGNLFAPPVTPRSIRGTHSDVANSTSLYTKAFEWHPFLKPALLATAAIGVAALLKGRARPRNPVQRARDWIG